MNKFQIVRNSDSYYTVGDIKTFSKVDAIRIAKGDMSKIHFYWMEDTWNNVDWTVDPIYSWKELLRIRCQQIRDKYSYVALWYSSGFDSHTILRTFVDNNILLDEILVYDRCDFFHDPEIEVALTHAKYIKDTYYPNLKINYVKVDYKSLKNFYLQTGDEWIYHPGCTLKLGKTTRYFATNMLEEFNQARGSSSVRGDIMGVDKAKVILRDGKWYAFCPDGSTSEFIGSNQETFYYSRDLPELHVKQCRMIIDWFETFKDLNSDFINYVQGKDRAPTGIHTDYFEEWNLNMGRYPLLHGHEFSRNGTHKLFHNNNETSKDYLKYYEYIKNNDKQLFDIYTTGLKNIRTMNPIGTTTSLADQTIISKQYYIRDRKVQAI